MKKIIVFCLTVFSLFSANAQQKWYREWGKSRIMSEAEFDNLRNVSKHRLIDKFSDARTIYETERKTLIGTDTLYDVKIIVKYDGEKSIHLTNFTNDNVFKKIGQPFPDFKLKSFDGKTYSMKDFKGKPMLINYWFHTCGPCKAEMPALNKLKEKYGDKVHFVSVTIDTKELAQKVLNEHPFHFFHLLEASDLIRTLGINGAPKNIFVDKKGVIRQVYEKVDDIYNPETNTVSHGEGKELMAMLDKLIEE